MEGRAPHRRRHRPANERRRDERRWRNAQPRRDDVRVVGRRRHRVGAERTVRAVGAVGAVRTVRAERAEGRDDTASEARAHPAADRGPRTPAARPGPAAPGVQGIEVPLTATEPIVTHEIPSMGSTAELMIVGGAGTLLVEWALLRLEQLEAAWSRFRPDSDVARLDRQAGSGPVSVSADTADAVGRALSLWYVTDGRFDPTIRRALEAAGYDRTFRMVASDGPVPAAAPRPAPGCDGLRVDRVHSTVSVPDGAALDLGGIGKGLAADLVATGLIARGARGACVALGGDVRVAGTGPDGDAWLIPVEDPLDESKTLCTRRLDGSAIVTSTTRFRRWTRGGRELHHLIDPQTGTSADRGVTAVIAAGDEAWWAEGVAKAALIAGVTDGLELLERLGVAALVVDDDGHHHCTPTWEDA